MEEIGEEGFGGNPRLISVKQAQYKFKQIRIYKR